MLPQLKIKTLFLLFEKSIEIHVRFNDKWKSGFGGIFAHLP